MGLPKRLNRLALDAYKRRKQKSADTTLAHCLDVVRATVARTRYGFLVTTGDTPAPSARWVEPIMDDDFAFYIGTHPESRKIKEIAAHPAVTLALGNEDEYANLVVYGTATVNHDLATRERYWKSTWRMFFPHGPTGDDYCVIQVQAQRIELLSFSRNVIPEPFGLRAVTLERDERGWKIPDVDK